MLINRISRLAKLKIITLFLKFVNRYRFGWEYDDYMKNENLTKLYILQGFEKKINTLSNPKTISSLHQPKGCETSDSIGYGCLSFTK